MKLLFQARVKKSTLEAETKAPGMLWKSPSPSSLPKGPADKVGAQGVLACYVPFYMTHADAVHSHYYGMVLFVPVWVLIRPQFCPSPPQHSFLLF